MDKTVKLTSYQLQQMIRLCAEMTRILQDAATSVEEKKTV